MSGGFSSPALGGGGALIRPSAHSPNYIAGSSGWTINKDGSAEFNNLTLRGQFIGTRYVINSSGAFFYNGTPAAGNLIASIAAQGGTDAFGNGYLAGITGYDNGNGFFTNLSSGISLGTFVGAVFDQLQEALILNDTDRMILTGPLNSAGGEDDTARLQLHGGGSGNTTGGFGPRAILNGLNNTGPADLWMSGNLIKCNAAGNTLETWQNPAYNAGWASGPSSGTIQAFQVRHDNFDNVVCVGVFHCTSATPSANVGVLPAGYRPAITQRIMIASHVGSTITPRLMTIDTGGNISLVPNIAAANTDVPADFTFPLGNIG